MIVKMKKLTLLVAESSRRNLLFKLRNIGTLHVRHVSKPFSEELGSVEEDLSMVKKAIMAAASEAIDIKHQQCRWKEEDILNRAKDIVTAFEEKEHLQRVLRGLDTQLEWYKPWGGFNPKDIDGLKEKGIYLSLYRIRKKAFKNLEKRKDIHLINKDNDYAYIALASDKRKEKLEFDEVKLPVDGFEGLCEKKTHLMHRMEAMEEFLKDMSKGESCLRSYAEKLEKKDNFLQVMYGMKEQQQFSYLQGFCPVDKIKDIIKLSKQEGFGYLIEEPSEADEVPTLIRNPKWIRIINPVFKFMNTVPGYHEHDISFIFLLFFGLFFAMLIGDAGYGILFLIITFLARKKFKKIPQEPFLLMYVLSFATVIWGAVTGTWFGSEEIAQIPVLNSMVISDINSFLDTSQNFMIYLCFIIGIIHLTIAHLILAITKINSLKAIAEIGWIAVLWTLFFTAGTLILNRPFPSFGFYLLAIGLGLLLLFSNPQKNIIKGILISLGHLPLKIISSFSDVVSYLRL